MIRRIDDEWFVSKDDYGYHLLRWTGKRDENGSLVFDFRKQVATLAGALTLCSRMRKEESEKHGTSRKN